jgi:hypothetical protein
MTSPELSRYVDAQYKSHQFINPDSVQRCSLASFHEIEFENILKQKVEFLCLLGRELTFDILCQKVIQQCSALGGQRNIGYWLSRKKLYSPAKSLCWPSCISAPKRS